MLAVKNLQEMQPKAVYQEPYKYTWRTAMNLFEFFAAKKDFPEPYQDTENDDSQLKISDTRKTRLTLRQIQQLRRMNDVREIEKKNEVDRLKKIYGSSGESEI